MEIIVEAVYRDGVLVPDRSLGSEKEGKKFKLILVEEEEAATRRERFLKFVVDHRFDLPGDYRFNRDEIYER
jgi:predicted DNA-binding antitoxin AbrB/MazE fold protein